MKERKQERKGGAGKGSAGIRREKGTAPAGVTAATLPCCTGEEGGRTSVESSTTRRGSAGLTRRRRSVLTQHHREEAATVGCVAVEELSPPDPPPPLFVAPSPLAEPPSLPAVRVAGAASVGTAVVGAAAGERSYVFVTLTAGSGSVTSGTIAGASGHFCRRRKTLPPPLPKSGSPLPFEVAAGLPPSRFRDRHYFGSAVPSSFEWLWLLRKQVGAEVLTAVDSGQYERSQLASLGCDFNVSR
ncbi:uncharacterized protein DS421_13g416600 [Arachis hypogaea]|nr:uncharacterized protein DS421_13g416600 [Arachis hypogaea]